MSRGKFVSVVAGVQAGDDYRVKEVSSKIEASGKSYEHVLEESRQRYYKAHPEQRSVPSTDVSEGQASSTTQTVKSK